MSLFFFKVGVHFEDLFTMKELILFYSFFFRKNHLFLSALLFHIGHLEVHLQVFEIAKFWPILANLGQNYALFGVLLQGSGVPKLTNIRYDGYKYIDGQFILLAANCHVAHCYAIFLCS